MVVAQQKPFAVVKQFPWQRQQHVVIAAQCNQRAWSARNLGDVQQPPAFRVAEQHVEQEIPKRLRVRMQFSALLIGLNRLVSA